MISLPKTSCIVISSFSLVPLGLISVDKCMVRRSVKMGVVDVG
jgi:hypothetical protein